ncbi:DNA primase [Roseospira marina]|uniref:DNA primase n=1 Tax=Roseospira marina TaxID=140057 RepID=A0A5M6I5Q3_9PROT|nr:toprim domain-containing protein [Roseospira marina]KAA5603492.1 DNA primase [Roseospira marina]MBB4315480.1 DNA primase [Roseospira marina]MBB5088374.1 DNA primase [Roseospira marina]
MGDLEELLDAFDIEAYLDAEGLTYKISSGQSGQQLNLKECPVCGDTRWRAYLNAETGLGNCFVCDATFTKWNFVREHLGGCSNGEIFRHIRDATRDQGWRPRRTLVVATENTAEIKIPTSIPLPHEGQNLIYLEQRGFDIDLVRAFGLSYCQDAWWNYTKEDGSRGGQNFGGRVIIPVYDLDGELVTFQGRDVTGTSDRKYLFPATLPATGRFLYNGHNVLHTRRVVVGEGAFDVMALKKAIDGGSALRDMVPVGTFGKHLSVNDNGRDQVGAFLALRRGGVREVTICWDGEQAALEAACQAATLLSGIGLAVKIALLPKGCDPNEVPSDVLRQALIQAKRATAAQIVRWRLRNPYRR